MKKIIGTLLYDTEKAEKIFSFIERKRVGYIKMYNLKLYAWYSVDIYRTKNGNYFFHGVHEDGCREPFIEEATKDEVKNIIKKLDVDKYISMHFEELEEA